MCTENCPRFDPFVVNGQTVTVEQTATVLGDHAMSLCETHVAAALTYHYVRTSSSPERSGEYIELKDWVDMIDSECAEYTDAIRDAIMRWLRVAFDRDLAGWPQTAE